MNIPKKLKQLREQKNYTQEEIADLLNISQSAYARMENGKTNAWVKHLDKICNVFEITLNELLKP